MLVKDNYPDYRDYIGDGPAGFIYLQLKKRKKAKCAQCISMRIVRLECYYCATYICHGCRKIHERVHLVRIALRQ